MTPQQWCKGVEDQKSWYVGPVRNRPKMHIWLVRGDKVQEVGVKRDSTRANEELDSRDLPDARKKVPAPVDVMQPVCILLSSAGFTELH